MRRTLGTLIERTFDGMSGAYQHHFKLIDKLNKPAEETKKAKSKACHNTVIETYLKYAD